MRTGSNDPFAPSIEPFSPGIPKYSSDTIKHWRSTQIEALEQRHKQLERKYEQLLQKSHRRRLQHQALKGEINAYSKLQVKDREEISKLQSLIRHHKLQQREEKLIEGQWLSRHSRINKFDQSTEDQIKVKTSGEQQSPKQMRPSSNKAMKISQQVLAHQPQFGIFSRMKREVKESKNFRAPPRDYPSSYLGLRYS